MRRFAIRFLMATAALIAVACGGGGGGGGGESIPDIDFHTAIIGPQGGIIEEPGGAVLEIPAGALDAPVEIGIKTYATSAAYAGSCAGDEVFPISSAVILSPDGLMLKSPARLAMPVEGGLDDGGEYLVLLRREDGGWDARPEKGTYSSADGEIRVDIEHFCTFAATGLSYAGIDSFGSVLESSGGDGDAACAALEACVRGWGGDVFSMRKSDGDHVSQVCGVDFDAMWKYGDAEGERLWTIGEKTDDYTIIDASSDRTVGAWELIVVLRVMLYWKKVELDFFEVSLDFAASGSDEETDLTLSSYSMKCRFLIAVDPADTERWEFACDYSGRLEDDGEDPNYPMAKILGAEQAGGDVSSTIPEMFVSGLAWSASDNPPMALIGMVSGLTCSAILLLSTDHPFGSYDEWIVTDDGPLKYGSNYLFSITLGEGTSMFRLEDGYSGGGAGMLLGYFGVFNGSFTVAVRKTG